MNINSSGSRSKSKKKTPNKRLLIYPICLLFVLFIFILSYTEITKSLFSNPSSNALLSLKFPQCRSRNLGEEKFLWFSPHSGFNNQFSELKNAILIASILNRTLIIPPILDHHAVALGSCPKFRVLDPNQLRFQVWNHIVDLIRSRRYVSMADIVDLSSLESSPKVKMIDFRVFAMLWCGIDTNLACFDRWEAGFSLFDKLKQCGSLLSGMDGNAGRCLYAVDEDCRTTVWTYQGDDGILDSFQPDEQHKKKKDIAYVRKRKDVYKALGPGSEAGLATVLAFGSLFTAPYKGSELYVDIHDAPKDPTVRSLFEKLDSLTFVPDITNAARDFALEKIKTPFLCAQLRLLDGQFKNHRDSTFLGLKQKLESLKKNGVLPVNMFVMTDLPEADWRNSYLGELAKDSGNYTLHNLRERDELVVLTAKKIANEGRGMRFGSKLITTKKISCAQGVLPDILLYIEEAICSCALLGFVGTSGSTIAESIELMIKNGVCVHRGF
ncbi:O-fucosyltransferase [Thalictrum thalictroides]|uniref:O-fucosyltransferase family protein n=1 Tax=Thalictrum thalictroides TaxID=46969 RepID=A0A7J6UUT3_THATH|nr:O-fucosyltransferase [Thalictrum thalictroides]